MDIFHMGKFPCSRIMNVMRQQLFKGLYNRRIHHTLSAFAAVPENLLHRLKHQIMDIPCLFPAKNGMSVKFPEVTDTDSPNACIPSRSQFIPGRDHSRGEQNHPEKKHNRTPELFSRLPSFLLRHL